MDERAKAEFEALKSLFEHPGWTTLVRNTQQRIEAFRSASPFNIANNEQLYFAKGMIATLTELVNMPTALAAAEAALAEEAADEAPEGE